jgi:hypothetical protein
MRPQNLPRLFKDALAAVAALDAQGGEALEGACGYMAGLAAAPISSCDLSDLRRRALREERPRRIPPACR